MAGHKKTCGIYYLTDGLDVLYVGKSTNVEARIAQWRSNDIDFSQVFVDKCQPQQLDRLECEAIRRYDPPFNIVGRSKEGEAFFSLARPGGSTHPIGSLLAEVVRRI